jgi:hypothetical protein
MDFNSPSSEPSCTNEHMGKSKRYLSFLGFPFVILAGLSILAFGSSLGQTLRTPPSASSTTATIPSSSSTSANAPCNLNNPTSPCYSAGAPRNPCYSAMAPDRPCSSTTAYPPDPLTQLPTTNKQPTPGDDQASSRDQAKAQIESKGYSTITSLRRDDDGVWRGRAKRNGSFRNVRLDREGNVTEN